MFVCNCNGINCRQVKEAKKAGAKKWSDVHAHFDCKPQCGQCGVDIAKMLNDEPQSQSYPTLPSNLVGA